MKLNAKVILLGGLVMYVAQWVVGMISGVVLHEGVLDSLYQSVPEFWRPELNQDPPDMAALMPRWVGVGVVTSFVIAGIYDNIKSAFEGSGVVKGVKFGVVVALIHATYAAGYSGVFNLPETIWLWWSVDSFVIYIVGGLVLGWFVEKFCSD